MLVSAPWQALSIISHILFDDYGGCPEEMVLRTLPEVLTFS